MNKIVQIIVHALDVHLHHNTDRAIDFSLFKKLNEGVVDYQNIIVGPDANDDAGVYRVGNELFVAKMESHCSPCVVLPYDSAATGAGGAMRDVVAMGARPLFLLDFIGTRPLEEKVIVGPCGFQGKCTCGNCVTMTSKERIDIMVHGLSDMCKAMDVAVIGGGFSTSFSDIVPALVVSVFGQMVAPNPVTKPAKKAGDVLILVGVTSNDGNDTLYRAGMVNKMRPAIALFKEERMIMEAVLSVFQTGKIKACSDLGAAGLGAAVCESARAGNLGAYVNIGKVQKTVNLSDEEIILCETQGRYLLQADRKDYKEVLSSLRESGVVAEEIGHITPGDNVIFGREKIVAIVPNNPSLDILKEVKNGL